MVESGSAWGMGLCIGERSWGARLIAKGTAWQCQREQLPRLPTQPLAEVEVESMWHSAMCMGGWQGRWRC
jgi:hypothetical protein